MKLRAKILLKKYKKPEKKKNETYWVNLKKYLMIFDLIIFYKKFQFMIVVGKNKIVFCTLCLKNKKR
jgi:ribonucleotide reductase beta subunit family protein with ferritin-like domain